VTTKEEAKRFFSALGQNDARALCFMWLGSDDEDQEDLTLLCRSAELGFAFAQACLAGRTRCEEGFKFAQMAAAQAERDGYYWFGVCFRGGEGCEENPELAKENFLRASELGHVSGMRCLGDLLNESDPQPWRWWGRAAALGESWSFLANFAQQVRLFNSGSGSDVVKSNCSILAVEVLLSCLQLDEFCKDMLMSRRKRYSAAVLILAWALQNKQSHSTRRKSKQRQMRCVHGLLLASS
jgi:hypothetical protein